MAEAVIKVNRAPVMTLWAAIVAERLGHDWDEALTLGKVLAGLNAHSKGRRLGIYGSEEPAEGSGDRRRRDRGDHAVELMGREVPVKETDDGVRALSSDQTVEPASVETYLKKAFGDHLEAVTKAMRALARSLDKADLENRAYDLYEEFRPQVSSGRKGWGQRGELKIDEIEKLADK